MTRHNQMRKLRRECDLDVPEWHRLQIAKNTLTLSEIGVKILGGMTHEEARQVIAEFRAWQRGN